MNAHAQLDVMRAWLDTHDVHASVEPGEARGTAGALGLLHDWLDGRPVMLTNADAWYPPEMSPVVDDLRRRLGRRAAPPAVHPPRRVGPGGARRAALRRHRPAALVVGA